jgi:hypothetical protein
VDELGAKVEKLPDAHKDVERMTVLSDKPGSNASAGEHKKFKGLILVTSAAMLILWSYIALLYFVWPHVAREFGWHAKPIAGG